MQGRGTRADRTDSLRSSHAPSARPKAHRCHQAQRTSGRPPAGPASLQPGRQPPPKPTVGRAHEEEKAGGRQGAPGPSHQLRPVSLTCCPGKKPESLGPRPAAGGGEEQAFVVRSGMCCVQPDFFSFDFIFIFLGRKLKSHILSSYTVIPGNHSGVKDFWSVRKQMHIWRLPAGLGRRQPTGLPEILSNVAAAAARPGERSSLGREWEESLAQPQPSECAGPGAHSQAAEPARTQGRLQTSTATPGLTSCSGGRVPGSSHEPLGAETGSSHGAGARGSRRGPGM